jgi:hypothetical protein
MKPIPQLPAWRLDRKPPWPMRAYEPVNLGINSTKEKMVHCTKFLTAYGAVHIYENEAR